MLVFFLTASLAAQPGADVLSHLELAKAAAVGEAGVRGSHPEVPDHIQLVESVPGQVLQLRHHVLGSQVWDASSGRDLGALLPVHAVLGSVSEDGAMAVTVNTSGISAWSVATGEKLWTHAESGDLHDGERFVDEDSGMREMWSIDSRTARVFPEMVAVRMDLSHHLTSGIQSIPDEVHWMLLDPSTGREKWIVKADLAAPAVQILAGRKAWRSGDDAGVLPSWKGQMPRLQVPEAGAVVDGASQPRSSDNRTVRIHTDKRVYLYDLGTGDSVASEPAPSLPPASSMELEDGADIRVWQYRRDETWIVAVDGDQIRWKAIYRWKPMISAVGDATILIWGTDVVALDGETGRVRWTLELPALGRHASPG